MANITYREDLFKDRVAVVTGGTSGLGAGTAFYLAKLGAKVYAVGLKADVLEVPAGLNIEVVELDVTDEGAVKKFFSKLDQVDILFNGAGANFENHLNP